MPFSASAPRGGADDGSGLLRFPSDDAIVVDKMKGVAHVTEEDQNRRTPTTIQELSISMDRRFEGVDAAIVEQRQYTEFAFGQLQQELVVVKSGLARVERKLDRLIDGATFSPKPEAE